MGEFSEVYHHRLRYFLTPQFDMYRNVRKDLESLNCGVLSILDYGCGNGVGSVLLTQAEWDVMGIDSDEEAVAFAESCWGHLCTFYHEDWCNGVSEFSKQTFDAIVCLEVIEHVKDPEKLLCGLASRVRRVYSELGCRVYISTLNHNSQYRKNRGHVGKFCLCDFENLVQEFFPGAQIYDYTLKNLLEPDSSITPMVAVWKSEDA